MTRKMPSRAQPDDYPSDEFDDGDTLISRNRANPRPRSSLGFSIKKSNKKGKNRPVTPGKGRTQSALGFRSGKDMWMNAIKKRQTLMHSNSRHGESPRHKTPIEYWVETLRKTGNGISTESSKMNTFSGLKGANEKFYPYFSTSHYLRSAMGLEKPSKQEDPTVKPSPGRPAYKTQEEYYDEVLELRKQIAALNHDSATMKTKIRRLEEDNLKKEKEIESLLNPGKSEEIRRTMGDRKPDSGAVIHSLKQKILKLEVQHRDRESAHNKLKADLKVTKMDEMRLQMEAFYQEIVRLQNVKSTAGLKGGSENSVKVKALNETILRLSRSNESLQQENKSLKEDLENAISGAETMPDLEREHEDKNRKELLLTIAALEKRVEHHGDLLDSDSLASGRERDSTPSKLVLKGSVEQRLSQLDKRETQLLDEIHRLKLTIRRLREERARKDDRDFLPPTPTPRRKASQDVRSAGSSRRPSSARRESMRPDERVSPRRESLASEGRFSGRRDSAMSRERGSSRRESVASDSRHSGRRESVMSEDRYKNVQSFTQKHAATSIQRQWRNRRQRQLDQEQDKDVEHFRQNRAAKKIQGEWIGYRHRKHEAEVDDASATISAALSGHRSRRKRMQRIVDDDDSTTATDDDDVFLIQSSIKGHRARLEQMKRIRQQRYDSYEDEDEYYDTKSPGQSRRPSLQRPSSAKRSRRKSSTPAVHTFKPRYGSGLIGQYSDDKDDDDDIMF